MKVMKLQKTLIYIAFIGSWAVSQIAIANPHKLRPFSDKLRHVYKDRQKLNDHPFQDKARENNSNSYSLDLLRKGAVNLDQYVRSAVRKYDMHPGLELRAQNKKRAMNLQWAGIQQARYKLFYDNVEVCGFEIVAHSSGREAPWLNGNLPVINFELIGADDWPDLNNSLSIAIGDGEQWGLVADGHELLESQKCWQLIEGDLVPAWKLKIKFGDGLPYEFMVNENMESILMFPGQYKAI